MAVVVTFMAVAIFGMAALVVDVGALYAERRELQTGADAGALAIAQDCSDALCPSPAQASGVALNYAKQNASDSLAAVPAICSNEATLYGDQSVIKRCTTDPNQLPLGVKYVRVTDGTKRASTGKSGDDTSKMLSTFASVLPVYAPKQVTADSVAAWGSMARPGPSIPLIISACEWEIWTQGGTKYAPAPPWTSGEPWSYETEIITHSPKATTSGNDCRTGGGYNYNIAGGFGWLDPPKSSGPVKSCQAQVSSSSTVPSKQGMQPCVRDLLRSVVDAKVPVEIPIYTADPIKNEYLVSGWARFYLTGYAISGKPPYHSLDYSEPLPLGATPKKCITTPSEDCLTGFFLPPLPPTAGMPTGPSFGGATVVSLIQ